MFKVAHGSEAELGALLCIAAFCPAFARLPPAEPVHGAWLEAAPVEEAEAPMLVGAALCGGSGGASAAGSAAVGVLLWDVRAEPLLILQGISLPPF